MLCPSGKPDTIRREHASYHHGHGDRPLDTVLVATSDVKCEAKVVERKESYVPSPPSQRSMQDKSKTVQFDTASLEWCGL